MPVAVRLSRNFYDRFGDEATNELVTLLNDVDLTYRSELKDAFANNIAVFDAKLEQRLAAQDARIEKRLAEQDARFEKRFATIDIQFAEVRGDMKGLQSTLLRWMFGFWAATVLSLAGLLVATRS